MLAFKLCSKSYTQFSNLCRHKRTHLEVKSTLNCKYCFTAFQSTASFNKHETICMRERYEASNMNESFGETCIKDSSGTDLSEKEFETDGSFSNKSPARQLPPDSQSGASPFSRHLIELNSLLLKIQQDQQQQQQKQELIPSLNTLCYLIQSVLAFLLNKPVNQETTPNLVHHPSNLQFNLNPTFNGVMSAHKSYSIFGNNGFDSFLTHSMSNSPSLPSFMKPDEVALKRIAPQVEPSQVSNELMFCHYLNYAIGLLNLKNSIN